MEGVKTYILYGLLALILGMVTTNTFWPKTPKLSQESVERIDAALEQWQQFGKKMEENTRSVSTLNELMKAQIVARQLENDTGYDEALRRYGFDPGGPPNDINLRMLDSFQGIGRGNLPGSAEPGNPDPTGAATTPGGQAPTDRSKAGPPDNSNDTPASGTR